VVRDVLQAVSPQAELAGVALSASLAPDLPPVRGDATSVATVLSNLVVNGIKYNRTGGQVTVGARRENGTARLVVADTGIGIAPESLPRIFDEFYRAGAEASGIPGTGLGLAICRRIVHGLGGAIAADSTPGVGSTFTVTLPLVLPELQEAARVPERVANRHGASS
jgi:signal transduction histidine kinase